MKYHICYGLNSLHFVEVDDGVSIATGQTYNKDYTDEEEAIACVLEQDENYFPDWDREKFYSEGNRVKFGTCIYRALQDNDVGSFELPNLDLEPGAEIPTPKNRQARWAMVCDPEFEENFNEEESY